MKKRRETLPIVPPPHVGNGSGGPVIQEQEIVVRLKGTLYARFLSVLPPGAKPEAVIADLVRQATKAEYTRRVMAQIDDDL